MGKGESLSIFMYANTLDQKRRMASVPYSSANGSLIYNVHEA